MIQYTTPTFLFDINVPENVIDNIEVTFKQANTGVEIQKELVKDRLAIIDNKLNVHLSESETGKFSVGSCQVQMRVLTTDGKVLASEIARIKVEPSLSDDILVEGVSDGEDSSYDAGYADGYSKGVAYGKANAPTEDLSITLTSNGTYSYKKPQDKYHADVEVVVNVPSEKTPTQEKTKTITKNGTEVISPDEGFALEKVTVITDIPERLPTQTKTIDIEENGTEEVTADSGYALEKVIINTDIDTRLPEQTKEVTIKENGTTNISPDDGYTLAGVSVTTEIDTRLPEQEKSLEVTENGTYEVVADEGKTLSKVNVNVEVAGSGGGGDDGDQVWKVSTIPNSEFVSDMTRLAHFLSKIEYIGNIDNLTSAREFFSEFRYVKEIILNDLDTSNVTDMNSMFYRCYAVESLDLSKFNTSKVTDMSNMFYVCKGLKSLDLSSFDTSNVITMQSMFCGCSVVESLDLSSFDTSKVTYMSGMFRDCDKLTTLDLSSFDTSKVTDMSNMFANDGKLENVIFGNNWASNKSVSTVDCYYCPLSKASILDLANKIADKSDTSVYTGTYKVRVKSTQKALFTEEEQIELANRFTAKNWTFVFGW